MRHSPGRWPHPAAGRRGVRPTPVPVTIIGGVGQEHPDRRSIVILYPDPCGSKRRDHGQACSQSPTQGRAEGARQNNGAPENRLISVRRWRWRVSPGLSGASRRQGTAFYMPSRPPGDCWMMCASGIRTIRRSGFRSSERTALSCWPLITSIATRAQRIEWEQQNKRPQQSDRHRRRSSLVLGGFRQIGHDRGFGCSASRVGRP